MSGTVTVLATDGSLSTSLFFLGPVAMMLIALLVMTIRERRRERDDRRR
jgi:cytochrome c-type biogenesis protein CcmH/NrfF